MGIQDEVFFLVPLTRTFSERGDGDFFLGSHRKSCHTMKRNDDTLNQ